MDFSKGFLSCSRLFISLLSVVVFFTESPAQLITVKPGQLDHFTVSAPEEAVSGEDFFIQIKAYDAYGNIITNYSDVGKSVKLVSSGSQQLMPKTLSASSFIGGVATVKAVYYKAELISITVKDFSEAASGKSSDIRIKPNTIHHFAISAPSTIKAGEELRVAMTALDAYDNVVVNYNEIGKGVNVSTSGTSKISPNFIQALAFTNGTASVTFSYNKAENITINLSEKDRPEISKSNRITVLPGNLERYVVTTEGVATAGKKFTIKIKAVDAYDNVISNYNEIGKDVILSTTGTGELSPNRINASSFVDGLATVSVSYNKAESFSINVYQEGVAGEVERKPATAKKPVPAVEEPTTALPEKVEEEKAPAEEQAGETPEEDFSDLLITE